MVASTIGKSAVAWAAKPYPEITRIARASGSIVIIPVGSLEQHGRHMPTATDTILADAIATDAAEEVSHEIPVLVTPPVWTGLSPHHLAFGGTISLTLDELTDLVVSTVETAVSNGFDAALLLNGHGGNAALITDAAVKAGMETDAEVLALTYFSLAESFVDDIRESEHGGIAHAG